MYSLFCVRVPCEAWCCQLEIDEEDWSSLFSDRSTGSCSSPATTCWLCSTHLSVTLNANGDHPPSGRLTTSPEPQRTTDCAGINGVIKPIPYGVTTAACCNIGHISGLENSTLLTCILSAHTASPNHLYTAGL